MKVRILQIIILLLAAISPPIVKTATAAPIAEMLDAGDLLTFFVSELSPYGRWSDEPRYGRVWTPNDQSQRDWRPYSRGHWQFSQEYGWVWKPDEKWGEIPYHYGRWTNSNNRWFWVPDRTWGPAWVDWRQNDDYIGWAPLPPEAAWRGEGEWQPQSSYFTSAPTNYITVPQRYFGDTNVYRYIVPRDRNSVVLNRALDITRYRIVDRRVRNEGPSREVIERVIGRRIEPVRYEPRPIQRERSQPWFSERREIPEHEHEQHARFQHQNAPHYQERRAEPRREEVYVTRQPERRHAEPRAELNERRENKSYRRPENYSKSHGEKAQDVSGWQHGQNNNHAAESNHGKSKAAKGHSDHKNDKHDKNDHS